MQRAHVFVMLLYGLALQMIVHLILKSFLLSRSCQMYLDSSVLFMWLLWRNECLCCVNLCLNVPYDRKTDSVKNVLYEVRCLKSNEDMILALTGQFKQLSHEPEKLMIINSKPDELLNKRSELISKCRHENKFYLRNN